MLGPTLLIASIACYLIASTLVLGDIRLDSKRKDDRRVQALGLGSLAAVLQLIYIWLSTTNGTPMDFSLDSMVLVVSNVVVICFLLGCLGMDIHKLGVLVFPLTGLCLIFTFFWEPEQVAADARPLFPISAFSAHVIVALLAYSLITIAAIQSILYLYQDRQFRQRTAPGMLASLPPLQTMETLLFRLVWMGFALLSATLLSGAIFSREIFDQAFEFNHHTVLALMGWCVFAALLYQRHKNGIRSTPATALTIAGFLLIQLGYFGTKIVNESLNL